MRIDKNLKRGQQIVFTFNGENYLAYEGESVACALFCAGMPHLRNSPHLGSPRGMFCLMGSCQECVVTIQNRKVLACQTPVVNGLQVNSGTERDDND